MDKKYGDRKKERRKNIEEWKRTDGKLPLVQTQKNDLKRSVEGKIDANRSCYETQKTFH